MREKPVDYKRLDYQYRQHHARYARRAKADGLICQECGGRGYDGSYSSYSEPPEPCGWCETTGYVTRWMRGLWLRCQKQWKARPAA